ncbi:MAG: cytochrome c family protein [Desulfovibrionaceae bacterium]|nr:cytochrome c family protein [Desulfovibrionaceae bacterium]MBF0514158.1 cytochrome c family protein [Desulfovibrionaceae bacterium]
MTRVRLIVLTAVLLCFAAPPAPAGQATYAGSKACEDCHQEEYRAFTQYAKKAKSYKSIKILADKITPAELTECYGCHTTGYGKPGGFVSLEKTPDLANAGCEVCHGPGSDHVSSGGDPKLIVRKPAMDECKTCHNGERVKSFGFKPLTHAGAH